MSEKIILMEEIGYNRIARELQATELDAWQEYVLIEMENVVDTPSPVELDSKELIHLLKMNCPSTGKIHTLRVSPWVASAREAIRWLNWGIDPEEFAVKT